MAHKKKNHNEKRKIRLKKNTSFLNYKKMCIQFGRKQNENAIESERNEHTREKIGIIL
jgi:hypothetical protein